MLAAAGVLKFVDQQMADSVGDGLRGIDGKFIFAFEHVERDLRDLGKVGRGGLGKDDAKLGSGAAQKSETGANDLPFRVGVPDWSGLADGAQERRFETQTEAVEILFALQNEFVHPAVAVGEHFTVRSSISRQLLSRQSSRVSMAALSAALACPISSSVRRAARR